MSFSVKVGLGQLYPLQCQFSNNKNRSSIATLPSATIQRPHGVVISKVPEDTSTSKTNEKSQIQSLVDLLRDCSAKGSIREGKAIHAFSLRSDFEDDKTIVLFNHVADMYSKCSHFVDARRVFDEMTQKNVFSWTVMIVGSTENRLFFDGFRFYSDMLNHGILPDEFAYSAVLQSCIGLDCVESGEMVHGQIVKRGFLANIYVISSLVSMYAKLGKTDELVRVFNTVTERNQVSYTAVISGFTSNGLHLEAFNQFLAMKMEGFAPTRYTFCSVLKAVGKLGDVSKGREVHNYVIEMDMESDTIVGTSLIDMYSKCGFLSDARSIFDNNFTHCRVNNPWNAMISGYSQDGHGKEAVELFAEMCLNDVKPDLYTYCSVFSAIAALKCLQLGRQVHGVVVKTGYDQRVLSVNNAMADAYSKCGALEDAKKVFRKMEEIDVVSWTTLVTAYSQCSEGEETLHIFSQMREKGFTPNQFTFASVLVACASLCFLEYGRQVHSLLCKAGLGNDECTESALIDMYAKCGSITEAEKVFKRIASPDVVSWTAIISGYAQHGFTDNALQLFKRMEQSGIKANGVTLLCILFACSHGGMVNEGLHYFRLMEERYGVVPKMEHYACIVDLLGRVGRLNEALKFIDNMPIEPMDMVWQSLLGACRVYGNAALGEIAAKKILSVRPEYSATYVLLSNTYIEKGSFKDGLALRNIMKGKGVKKDPGYSWISVKGRIHKFCSGDQQHPQKDDVYAMLYKLREKAKAMGYVPDFRYVLQDIANLLL